MPQDHMDVGVIVARQTLDGRWATHAWLPHAVLPGTPAVEPGTRIGDRCGRALVYAGACQITLHAADTAHYRDNLVSARPSLWVALGPADGGDACAISMVTADPYEGEALTEGIGVIVDAVPMPAPIQSWIAAFVDAFHVERPFIKRERDRTAYAHGGDAEEDA